MLQAVTKCSSQSPMASRVPPRHEGARRTSLVWSVRTARWPSCNGSVAEASAMAPPGESRPLNTATAVRAKQMRPNSCGQRRRSIGVAK